MATNSDDLYKFYEILKKLYENNKRYISGIKLVEKKEVFNLKSLTVCFVIIEQIDEYIVNYIEILRQKFKESYLIFVMKDKYKIFDLVRPSIQPSGIISFPVDDNVIKDLYTQILIDINKKEQQDQRIKIKIEGEYINLPISMILYLESKDKKMIIRTIGQEISFYSTFERISQHLTSSFIRCHKGYMVNKYHIKKVVYKDKLIILDDESIIPFSRTYRDNIKALLGDNYL